MRHDVHVQRTYDAYVPNKTISLPADVLPIIETLEQPFSVWVADQLRRHAAARPELSFGRQLVADAALAGPGRPSARQRRAVAERMERSAPW